MRPRDSRNQSELAPRGAPRLPPRPAPPRASPRPTPAAPTLSPRPPRRGRVRPRSVPGPRASWARRGAERDPKSSGRRAACSGPSHALSPLVRLPRVLWRGASRGSLLKVAGAAPHHTAPYRPAPPRTAWPSSRRMTTSSPRVTDPARPPAGVTVQEQSGLPKDPCISLEAHPQGAALQPDLVALSQIDFSRCVSRGSIFDCDNFQAFKLALFLKARKCTVPCNLGRTLGTNRQGF